MQDYKEECEMDCDSSSHMKYNYLLDTNKRFCSASDTKYTPTFQPRNLKDHVRQQNEALGFRGFKMCSVEESDNVSVLTDQTPDYRYMADSKTNDNALLDDEGTMSSYRNREEEKAYGIFLQQMSRYNFSTSSMDDLFGYDEKMIADVKQVDAHLRKLDMIWMNQSSIARVKLSYNTTSSIHIEDTMLSPSLDQLVYCISAVIQGLLVDDDLAHNGSKYNGCSDFNVVPELPPELGGVFTSPIPEKLIEKESQDNEDLRQKLKDGRIPLIDNICRFLLYINYKANYSLECNLIALVYVNRIVGLRKIRLSNENWRLTWIGCLIIAQKVWDDKSLRSSSFATMLPPISKRLLRTVEFRILEMLDFTAVVKLSTYARYFFQLRQLHNSIIGADWNIKPLSVVQARALQRKSASSAVCQQSSPNNGKFNLHSDGNTSTNVSISDSMASTYKNMKTDVIDHCNFKTNRRYAIPAHLLASGELSDDDSNHHRKKYENVAFRHRTTEDIYPIASKARYVLS